ncbi:hypothetical protein TUN199_07600 [Pyrenophora tritici-repentis]|uniref:Uncharacterized protein n=1 Tax=Pyrenophora tritici-repentis TaxID=45151 RepID=A0A5M9KVM2_9PLEO|nr:hypothetical protein PtrV1_11666 [Pyrenophora tritici-repentis]KAF7564881.1 hypothetical protein PtrM4_043150 [Pyrenophora tritici-repentis]KAI0579239.1 hypothetical protein Alg130_07596 [Pyrenophora tritici-repentis]KAI0584297.1 hypothetical protein Alg215_03168 [Pyrenophora tritici-repentis]KAI0608000.1 hypothetical protein TUN205_07744 [Pyrenophora tritici-repentis]
MRVSARAPPLGTISPFVCNAEKYVVKVELKWSTEYPFRRVHKFT